MGFSSLMDYFELTGFVRVLENLESPGMLLWHFPGLESPEKMLWSWKVTWKSVNSSKKYEVYGRQEGEVIVRSWE